MIEINSERREVLAKVSRAIIKALEQHEEILLLFVCTHNSRRSQAAEWWARRYCHQYGFDNIKVASAGTEVTAFYTEMIKAINRVEPCLKIDACHAENQVMIDTSADPVAHMYSKKYDDASLAHPAIVAVMVCDSANENCPIIPNAMSRVALTFTDPKYADGTEEVIEAYDTCVKQIGNALEIVMLDVLNSQS